MRKFLKTLLMKHLIDIVTNWGFRQILLLAKFNYCVEYLDNLHPNRKLIRDLEKEEKRKEKEAQERENKRKKLEKELEETNEEISEEFTDETLDRYSY